jgi:hypothetical protein
MVPRGVKVWWRTLAKACERRVQHVVLRRARSAVPRYPHTMAHSSAGNQHNPATSASSSWWYAVTSPPSLTPSVFFIFRSTFLSKLTN